jgi:hypothetical protein
MLAGTLRAMRCHLDNVDCDRSKNHSRSEVQDYALLADAVVDRAEDALEG